MRDTKRHAHTRQRGKHTRGTFPIQSERRFEAIQGKGGDRALVMLTHEATAQSPASLLMHVLASSSTGSTLASGPGPL